MSKRNVTIVQSDGKARTHNCVTLNGVPEGISNMLDNIKSHTGGSYWQLLRPVIMDFINSQPEHYRTTKLEK